MEGVTTTVIISLGATIVRAMVAMNSIEMDAPVKVGCHSTSLHNHVIAIYVYRLISN